MLNILQIEDKSPVIIMEAAMFYGPRKKGEYCDRDPSRMNELNLKVTQSNN